MVVNNSEASYIKVLWEFAQILILFAGKNMADNNLDTLFKKSFRFLF